MANDFQTEESLLGIRLMFTFVPAAFAIGSVVTIWFYPLSAKEVQQMETELAGRRDAEPVA